MKLGMDEVLKVLTSVVVFGQIQGGTKICHPIDYVLISYTTLSHIFLSEFNDIKENFRKRVLYDINHVNGLVNICILQYRDIFQRNSHESMGNQST